MEFWIFILCAAVVITGFPYIRCFIKRIICAVKLTLACKKKNYVLHKTHFLWFLGHKYAEKCDFYIETPDSIYSVKLFGVPKHHHILIFKADGDYFVRSHLYILPFVKHSFDSKPRTLPAYNFRCHFRDEWEIKTPHNVLLVHPVSMEIRLQPNFGSEVIVGAGDVVNGMEIQSLSRFLGELERNL
ncbi:MAG: hypothetical protein IKC03_00090 [Oscillospiraceae bacterium]|nr:hypothetical protein [Oscillospiraceae bacterium]